ncbi:hypothetical protein [Hansschlegelia zhihuaiae]|uniref:Uncharacterized protein n=1 Tax=Hansschlegelia zhihuaiae TaxID=405005 RepID=A0A4V1KJR2_9HYPH|nr:hypothetical protein [Hansschlegelia zhihuaiae]RXF75082.1 hypothetical protein EK403_03265 [Hansschlegelia zhihuaiae]
MFVIDQTSLFWWPVTVRWPSNEKPGQFDEQTFQMQFELLSRDETKKIFDDARAAGRSGEDANDELMRRVCKGWRDVQDVSGKSVAFTPESFAEAWRRAPVRIAVNEAYTAAMNGEAARLGN